MKRFISLSVILMFVMLAFGQDKQLTIEDASYMNRSLFSKTLRNLQWRGDSDWLAYVDNNAIVSGRAHSQKRDTLLRLDDISEALKTIGKEPLSRFPRITFIDKESFYFSSGQTLYLFDIKTRALKELNNYEEEAANTELDKNQFNLAYTIDNNLFAALDGEKVQITNDDDPAIINGQTVHRVEFGISKGVFWSPKGNAIAFYRKDESMVADYPLLDIDAVPGQPKNIKYPMAGLISEEVTIGVYNIQNKTTNFLNTGLPSDQYLTSVSWGPDEKFIYVGVLNRDQNHLKLNTYDAATGDFVQTLFEEQNDAYVEPENPPYFLSSKPDQFIWFSERDGYNHLYLYNNNGTLIKQLTQGEWLVTDYLGNDPKDQYAFFMSTIEGPLNKTLCSVNLENGKITKISGTSGTHGCILNKSGKFVIDSYSDTVTIRKYLVLDTKGKVLQQLFEPQNPLANYQLGKLSIFSLKADDGTELISRMIYPPDFDPNKKYPVLVYVYGGPHAQLITNSWNGGASLFLYYMAQQGYLVFTLDNRGSANRGRDFEQAIFRNLGGLEIEDQMTGVNYLKQLPYVDGERIGVNGWSYGGFMTISLMLKQADDFKVGVCGGPVTDWKYYEVMYGERYMDTPESNPEGYEAASLINHADKLEGKLLIIHGTDDPTVVWQHTLVLIREFITEGKQVDYFVYPGHGHGVGGKDRLHLNQKMANYFIDHL